MRSSWVFRCFLGPICTWVYWPNPEWTLVAAFVAVWGPWILVRSSGRFADHSFPWREPGHPAECRSRCPGTTCHTVLCSCLSRKQLVLPAMVTQCNSQRCCFQSMKKSTCEEVGKRGKLDSLLQLQFLALCISYTVCIYVFEIASHTHNI